MSEIQTPGSDGACYAGDVDAAPRTLRIDGADSFRKPTAVDERNS